MDLANRKRAKDAKDSGEKPELLEKWGPNRLRHSAATEHHFGYRRIVQETPPTAPDQKPKRRIVRLEPCPVESAIANELYHRVLVRGQSLASVCRDFQRRGLRDSEGKPFTDGPNGRSGSDTLRRMLQWVFRRKPAEVPKRLGVRGMPACLRRDWSQG